MPIYTTCIFGISYNVHVCFINAWLFINFRLLQSLLLLLNKKWLWKRCRKICCKKWMEVKSRLANLELNHSDDDERGVVKRRSRPLRSSSSDQNLSLSMSLPFCKPSCWEIEFTSLYRTRLSLEMTSPLGSRGHSLISIL